MNQPTAKKILELTEGQARLFELELKKETSTLLGHVLGTLTDPVVMLATVMFKEHCLATHIGALELASENSKANWLAPVVSANEVTCSICGSHRQIWINQLTNELKCHRVGCEGSMVIPLNNA